VVEVFQGDRISYEHPGAPRAPRSADDKPIGGYEEDGFVWSAYKKGIRLGMIASSDHWSTHLSYAMVYTEAPTRQAIFDAIKRRRTYGATDIIILDYRLGDGFMGEELSLRALPPLEITAIGTAEIERIDIVRNERVIHSVRPGASRAAFSYLDAEPRQGSSYYYVRVLQADRHVAWGSPIWVQIEP
jgi:hypothetical protein